MEQQEEKGRLYGGLGVGPARGGGKGNGAVAAWWGGGVGLWPSCAHVVLDNDDEPSGPICRCCNREMGVVHGGERDVLPCQQCAAGRARLDAVLL